MSCLVTGGAHLIIAIKKNQPEIVARLLTKTCNPNAVSDRGSSLLMIAIKEGGADIVAQLIKAGADVNAKNNQTTALIIAVEEGFSNIVAQLIEAGADVNAKNQHGKTALMMAVEKNQSSVNILLEAVGLDLSVKDAQGKSLLQLADGKLEILQACQIKMTKPSIVQLIEKLETEISRFQTAGESIFGIGNRKKAHNIREALNTAKNSKIACVSIQAFLTYKANPDTLSIIEALAKHRIGFFGEPRLKTTIDAFVRTLALP